MKLSLTCINLELAEAPVGAGLQPDQGAAGVGAQAQSDQPTPPINPPEQLSAAQFRLQKVFFFNKRILL